MKKILCALVSLFLCIGAFSDELFKTDVTASFYADKFHGRKTASGEKFNMYDYTAAHKTLPFGTVLKVTNLANGKSVNVRVNDRGPFAKGREIDVSKAAAKELDMIDEGTATVSLVIVSDATSEVTGKASAKTSTKKKESKATTSVKKASSRAAEIAEKARKREEQMSAMRWDVQIGAFGKIENAENMKKRLSDAGFSNVVFQSGPSVTRVVLHDIPTDSVQQTLVDLENAGFSDYFVRDSAD
jgi:rare lipoprotein A